MSDTIYIVLLGDGVIGAYAHKAFAQKIIDARRKREKYLRQAFPDQTPDYRLVEKTIERAQ